MKNSLLLFVVLFATYGNACDVCGGGSSNLSLGVLAPSQFHIVGIKSELKSFRSYLHEIEHSKEYLWRTEVTGRIQLHRRYNILLSVPYQHAWQHDDFGSRSVAGIGDVQSLLNGVLIDRRDSTNQVLNFLSIALGVKWATGRFVNYPDPTKNIYPGSGSTDGLLLLNYFHGISSKWSVQAEYAHTYKGRDKSGFRYGQAGNLTLAGIRAINVKSIRFLLQFGGQIEGNIASDYQGKVLSSTYSRGGQFAGSAGITAIRNNWVITINTRFPLIQHWYSGNVRQQPSVNASLNYLISKKKKNEKI